MNNGNHGGFEAFLDWLDPNRDAAVERFEALRRKLVAFFLHHGCPAPDCASECLLRLASRNHWQDIDNVEAFALGIARHIRAEYTSELSRTVELKDETVPAKPAAVSLENEVLGEIEKQGLLLCVTRCLEKLPASKRSVFIAFHACAQEDQIPARKRLADQLGVSSGTLRTRICRIRQEIEQCVRECCATEQASTRR